VLTVIDFSDRTIREAFGNYEMVKQIVESEGPPTWMLESVAVVSTTFVVSENLLHLWNNGEVHLIKTTHPMTVDTPDDDIRELSEWCDKNGWKKLTVDNDLLEDPIQFGFWQRSYYAGLINSEYLSEYEKKEMERMKEAFDREQEQENML
jgi:hypothetical protein